MSLVLHALWSVSTHKLLIWGERYLQAEPAQGQDRSALALPRHPFCASPSSLREHLSGLSLMSASGPGRAVEVGLILPTAQGKPRPSLPGLLDEEERPGPLQWSCWGADGLSLGPAHALGLLLAILDRPTSGLALGPEIAILAAAAGLALETVTQGRVLPTLEREGEDEAWVARWRPVPEGTLPRHLESLVSALPQSARAGAEVETWSRWREKAAEDWGDLPIPSSGALIYDLVWTLTDALSRGLLVSKPFVRSTSGGSARARALRAWLGALQSHDAFLSPTHNRALQSLEKLLSPWVERVDYSGEEQVRICFRISPPEEEGGGWPLEFLCQDLNDPSTLIPIEAAWRSGTPAKVLDRLLENPRKTFLREITRAAGLVSKVNEALYQGRVQPITLDVKEAFDFLRESAPLLERSGFGVLAPPWWTEPTRLSLNLTSSGEWSGGGPRGAASVFAFDCSVAMGGEVLDKAALRELAAIKEPLVHFRGHWVELRAEDIDKALDFVEKYEHAPPELTAAQIVRLNAGLDSLSGLPLGKIEMGGELGELFGGESTKMKRRGEPRGFVGKLRPYQKLGLSWLSFLSNLGLGACLADDMGLGKTIQVLAMLELERTGTARKRAPSPGPTLIICPMSVVGNWKRETQRFTPKLDARIHHGPSRLKGKAFAAWAREADLVITTYATATRDIKRLNGLKWFRVVLDEAQNIKNSETQQARAIKSLKVEGHKVALTGTPVENRLSELWSIMDFLNPGLLGTSKAFRDGLARPIEVYKDKHRAAQLQTLCGPFVLRRLKSDKKIIKDLPEKMEIKEFCTLTQEQATLYQAVLDESMKSIESSGTAIERRGRILAAMTRFKQVCNHPALMLGDGSALPGRSGKLTRLEELLESIIEAGEKTLVFTQYTQMARMLVPHLRQHLGVEVLYLHGQVSMKAREEMVQRFQGDKGPPVFLVSLKAGGTGLNLTAANHVIHYDRWWNPAVEDQATDRAYRIGQRKDVHVRKFICAGTLEARIDAMIEDKKELADRVISSGEEGLTELSTAALTDLFALSSDLMVG